MTIKRDLYLNKLISAKHDGFVKIITGIRRCGKSFLLTKLFRRHLIESGVPSSRIIMVDLDDDKNECLRDPRRLSEWVRRRIHSKRQEPDSRPALHRIAEAQRSVNNPSRGSARILSNLDDGNKGQI